MIYFPLFSPIACFSVRGLRLRISCHFVFASRSSHSYDLCLLLLCCVLTALAAATS